MIGPLPPEQEAWTRTLRREARNIWPFIAGFAVVGFVIGRMTKNMTEEVRAQAAGAHAAVTRVR